MSWIDDAETGLELEAEIGKKIADATEWKPEAGDMLVGTFVQLSSVITKYGTAFKLWIRDGKDEMFQVFASGAMLKEELLAAAPSVGMGIGIRYDGKAEGEYGKQLYYVNCEVDLSSDEAESDRQVIARKAFYEAIAQAEKIAEMKKTKKPERDKAPAFNGSADVDDLEAPF
jgi:hypothetical protein